ncbi:nucleotidyltransferase family protein [Gemella sp. GH3]|uniref:nucleotidyltransferase family protein n=1 Tax=unclassified Gemella TaxID=2624949 RepID=UPI0015D0919C|nr:MULTISPECIES: nucleotidyltransferase family protein [unclassified Gemella]MBF0714593.1 nucleotidyltransferase family protein [Gemella sp. GH3.1]NYS51545.1 nucleotidyltransferase family protein [Gemella sp. GH3]
MRIGIVAEFNPFHNGHKYLIDCAKEYMFTQQLFGDIIVVMSEFFTQRGEIAIVDGYTRAEEAVRAGADLILALPYRGSVAYSDDFAKKSIDILIKCGITHLIFGTEDDITYFDKIYRKEQRHSTKLEIKNLLKTGISYPKIMQKIFDIPIDNPNFTLAYSYYKAIKNSKKNITLIPIKRKGQKLNENTVIDSEFLSATTIRNNFESDIVKNHISNNMLQAMKQNSITENNFYNLIKYNILNLGIENLKNIYDVSEGLENRIYNCNIIAKDYYELVDLISTKRYTKKRIQRILLHILTNTTIYDITEPINHVRVLAVNKEKTAIIRQINNNENIQLHQKLKKENARFFKHDIKVSRIYTIMNNKRDIFKENIKLV